MATVVQLNPYHWPHLKCFLPLVSSVSFIHAYLLMSVCPTLPAECLLRQMWLSVSRITDEQEFLRDGPSVPRVVQTPVTSFSGFSSSRKTVFMALLVI